MSGPKISYYGLTKEQKQILNAQWRCYRDALADIAYVKRFADVMDERRYELLTLQLKLNHMADADAACTAIALEINALAATLHDTCADLKDKAHRQKPPALKRGKLNKETLTLYQEKLARTEAAKREALAFNARIDKAVTDAHNAIASYEKALYGDILQVLDAPPEPHAPKPALDNASLDLTGISMPQMPALEAAPDLNKLKAALADKLAPYAQNPALSTQLKAQIAGAKLKLNTITGLGLLKNFYAITVKPLLTESEKSLTRHTTLTAEYRELYSKYAALCELLDVKPETVPLTAQALNELKGIIADMEADVLQDAEQAQICNTIDDVMAALGYELLGRREVTKKSGKRFKHELFRFAEGTAVNITHADDGQITMELGGLDYTDRLPDEAEVGKLCAEMEAFCRDFETIEARLTERGVVVQTRTAAYPAAPEHAAIINLSDYNLTGAQPVATIDAQAPKRTTEAPKARQKDLP